MKRLIFFFLFLLFVSQVQAVSISPAGYKINQVNQAAYYEFPFQTSSTYPTIHDIVTERQPQWKLDYINRNIRIIESTSNSVLVAVNSTELLPPGEHIFFVRTMDNPPTRGMVSARAAVLAKIIIIGPYQQKYLDGTLNIRTSEPYEDIFIDVNVVNRGLVGIAQATSTATITDELDNSVIKTIPGQAAFPIGPGEGVQFQHDWKAPTLPAGFYPLEVRVVYDEKELILKDKVKIGWVDYEILNITTSAVIQPVVPIKIIIESKWRNEMPFFMKLKLKGKTSETEFTQTPTRILSAYGVQTIDTFINAQNLLPGEYELLVEGQFGNMTQNHTFPFALKNVVQEEQPSKLVGVLTSTNVLLLVVLFLLLMVIIKKRK